MMRGTPRPSREQSLHNAHADIETPSWRQYVPNCDSTNDSELSDDDTTAEAYIQRYHKLALAERRRWAGSYTKNQTSKSNRPLFPTPTEAFHLVRSALNTFSEKNTVTSNSSTQGILSRHSPASEALDAVEALETTLTCYAEVEKALASATTRLKASMDAHASHRGLSDLNDHSDRNRLASDLNVLYPYPSNSSALREPSPPIFPNPFGQSHWLGPSTKRPISRPPTPPLPSRESLPLSQGLIAKVNRHAHFKADQVENMFRLETSQFKDHLINLARKAEIPVSQSASFQTLAAAIASALRSHRAAKSEKNLFSSETDGFNDNGELFGSHVRREIDAEKYPLLARSMRVDPDYCLDGTRRPIEIIAQCMSNGQSLEQSENKPWEGLYLTGDELDGKSAQPEQESFKKECIIEPLARQETEELVHTNGFASDAVEDKKAITSPEKENRTFLTTSRFQTSRLDARRKLRQNVKRKLPRIHKERRTRKAFRFRDSAESISSRSSGASSSSPRWNGFREDSAEATGIRRRRPATVKFEHVVDLDDKEDGTEPSVVYLDDVV